MIVYTKKEVVSILYVQEVLFHKYIRYMKIDNTSCVYSIKIGHNSNTYIDNLFMIALICKIKCKYIFL